MTSPQIMLGVVNLWACQMTLDLFSGSRESVRIRAHCEPWHGSPSENVSKYFIWGFSCFSLMLLAGIKSNKPFHHFLWRGTLVAETGKAVKYAGSEILSGHWWVSLLSTRAMESVLQSPFYMGILLFNRHFKLRPASWFSGPTAFIGSLCHV
jgi:hypothetical protein